jgi:hypothetical protein
MKINLSVLGVRKFLTVFLSSAMASFLTLLVVEYFQGRIEDLLRIVGKAFMVGLALAILFAIPRKRKDYPWL